jgi:outer membrane protein OmpA-like peptidoglycan-associated protein
MAARARGSVVIVAWLAFVVIVTAGRAHAQQEGTTAEPLVEEPWALRGALSGGLMVTADQRERLLLDTGGGALRLSASIRPLEGLDWIEGELTIGGTVVFPGWSQPGGVLDVMLAARIAPRVGDLRPFAVLGIGAAFTGPFLRPGALLTVGVAMPITDEISLAPEISLLHVIQLDGPGQSDDAVFVSAGLSIAWRPIRRPAAPPAEIAPEPAPRTAAVLPPLPPPPPIRPVAMEEVYSLIDRALPGSTLRVVLLVPPVLFEHGEATLTAAGEVAMHDVLERVERADPRARVVIEGHADETGTPLLNLALSQRRADVVAAWLAAHGVRRARMVVRGGGTSRPIATGSPDDLASLAPDRRVTIRLELDGAEGGDATPADPPSPETAPRSTASPETASPETASPGTASPESGEVAP